MVRVVLGAVVSGIVVFCWGAIAHMMLPIGTMGLKSLSNEDEVLGMMGKTISDPGLYVFPGMDMSKTPTKAEEAAWTAKYKKGPTGILVIHPQGDGEPMSVRQLSVELLTDIAAALIAAIVLTQVRAGFLGRTLVVTAMAAFGFLSISASYWNWYGFPTEYELAEALDQLVGWFLGGLVLAAIVRPLGRFEKSATASEPVPA